MLMRVLPPLTMTLFRNHVMKYCGGAEEGL
jgi:hypothetical protein